MMMLGTIMIGAGLGLGVTHFGLSVLLNRENKKTSKEDLTEPYTQLFTHLKLMDATKGDWIKCHGIDRHNNYSLVSFSLSDTLTTAMFISNADSIAEKLIIKPEQLQIHNDTGKMYFRILNAKIELIPYKFTKTPKHLIPLGTDLDDKVVYWNLFKDAHIKVVGATGSGKSKEDHIIINHIYHNIPGAKMFMMDFKGGLELGDYAYTKNMVAYADELKDAPRVLSAVEDEHEKRIKAFKEVGVKCFEDYIKLKPQSSFKHAFLIIDEFADLMDLELEGKKKGEYDGIKHLVYLARKLRSSAIHIVISTQRPTADSIPSSMKNNITGTIGMKTENELNSRLVIDSSGCELLKQSECIGILSSEKVYFRSFFMPDSVIQDTVKQFKSIPKKVDPHAKAQEASQNEDPFK